MASIMDIARRLSPIYDDIECGVKELLKKLEKDQKVYVIDKSSSQPWKIAHLVSDVDDDQPIKLSLKVKILCSEEIIVINKYCIALTNSTAGALRLTKRVIAGNNLENLKSGTIADTPKSCNRNRYLVLMDDGSALYAMPDHIFPIIAQSTRPWYDSKYFPKRKELSDHSDDDRGNRSYCDFVREFFYDLRKRYLLSLKRGDKIEIYKDGLLVRCTVTNVDCDVVTIRYRNGNLETVYRGSPRFMQPLKLVNMRRARIYSRHELNPSLMELLHLYDIITSEHLRRDILTRPTARKSISSRTSESSEDFQAYQIISYPTMDSVVEHIDISFETIDTEEDHICSRQCLNQAKSPEPQYMNLVDDFRDVSDFMVPLMLGWIRLLTPEKSNSKQNNPGVPSKSQKLSIVYMSPCGKIIRDSTSLIEYLYSTQSKLDIDYFCFDKKVQFVREDQPTVMKCLYIEPNMAINKFSRQPLERKDIQVFNMFEYEPLPVYFDYSAEIVPHQSLLSTGFAIDKQAKSSCDCEDDCRGPNCKCHMNNEYVAGIETYSKTGKLHPKASYQDKRLKDYKQTGIYECNDFCKCSSKCPNRVVQNGMRVRMQIRKTLDNGWGVFAMDDIPRGSFLATYTGILYRDFDEFGHDDDTYLLDIDYVSKNEMYKETGDIDVYHDDDNDDDYHSYEDCSDTSMMSNIIQTEPHKVNGIIKESEDVAKLAIDGNELENIDGEVSSLLLDSLDKLDDYTGEQDGSIQLGHNHHDSISSIFASPSLSSPEINPIELNKQTKDDDSIKDRNEIYHDSVQNVSRERARNRTNYRKIYEILNSNDHTIDSKFLGNVSRFLNHSCDPNAFAQSVFTETHDPRFPTIAFFASRNIKAQEEITWNYHYVVGSIPGRVIECNCGSENCAGRVL